MILTVFDYLVFAIMIFFVFLGLVRGFIRELFSLINWIGSGFLTVLLRPYLNNIIAQKISNTIISNVVSSVLIFIIVIIGFSIILSNVARLINTKFPQSINITLGIAFGFTKGFLICSLIFASIINLFGNSSDLSSKSGPKWLQDSQTYRALSFGGYMILPFADSIFGQIKEKYSTPKNNTEKTENSEPNNIDNLRKFDKQGFNNVNDLIDKTEKTQDRKQNNDDGGYKKDQIEKLNHLLDVI